MVVIKYCRNSDLPNGKEKSYIYIACKKNENKRCVGDICFGDLIMEREVKDTDFMAHEYNPNIASRCPMYNTSYFGLFTKSLKEMFGKLKHKSNLVKKVMSVS